MKNLEKFINKINWDDINPVQIKRLISFAKDEDLLGIGLIQKPMFTEDVTTSALISNKTAKVNIVARQDLTPCGLKLIPLIINCYESDSSFTILINDGHLANQGEVLATIQGPSAELLIMERVILNFIQHLSGIASNTLLYSNALKDSDTKLLDTRKTTPGYRFLEKYAVVTGGGYNHRLGLFDRILIKDNHLASESAIVGERLFDAIKRAKQFNNQLLVEVEVDSIEQIEPVLNAKADALLLDNFNNADLSAAIDLIKNKAVTEASGGITLSRLNEIKSLGLDFISTGALIHQSKWVDIAFDWDC